MSRTGYSGGGEYHIRFNVSDHDYFLFDRVVRTGFGSDGLNYPEFTDGVVTKSKGKVTSVHYCSKEHAGNGTNSYDALMSQEEFDDIF